MRFLTNTKSTPARALIIAALAMAWAIPAGAQDASDEDWQEEPIILYHPPAEGYITVLANGTREPRIWNGVTVSIFDREAIAGVQGPDLTRLLERAPGVTLSRNGGVGSFTALRVRGAEAEQVLVLVDGVRAADIAAPGAGFDLGTLALGTLAKVELQRSANSTLWGSQAMGGVLAVTSDLAARPQVSLEYGSNDSLYATAGGSHETGPFALGLSAGWQRSDGISAAAGGTESDGYRQVDIGGRLSAQVSGALNAFVQARLADARVQTDGFPAPDYLLADTGEFQDTRQVMAAAGLNYYLRDLQLHATYARSETDRANFDPAVGSDAGYTARGLSRRADLRGTWGDVTDDWQVHFGTDYEWQSFATLFDARQATGIFGAFAQVDYDAHDVHLALGIRRDEHRQFGGEWSVGADAAWALDDSLRLTASFGEGFKAPSLFQLLSDYGNAALMPERARSYDAGVTWDGGDGWLRLTAFRRDTTNQIVFVSCFLNTSGICAGRPNGTYDNRARTRAHGFEAEGGITLADGLDLTAVYALVATDDRTPGSSTQGNSLPRRPRHAATLTAQWQPVQPLVLAADLRIVSHSFDDAANAVRLKGYRVLTLRGTWDLTDMVQLFARAENLTGADYQTAAGYAQPGRSAWLGIRWRL
jgi:vitamin B12 transporter